MDNLPAHKVTGVREAIEAVEHVQQMLGVSERRACRAMNQPRGTQRYVGRRRDDEALLIKRMHELVRRWPRFGYRRIHALLRMEGYKINRKRVYRLWRGEGFRVPKKTHKKRGLGISDNAVVRHRATSMNHVWCWDFIHDRDENGRMLKWLIIEDEFTREGLALEVSRSFKAVDVVEVLIVYLDAGQRPSSGGGACDQAAAQVAGSI